MAMGRGEGLGADAAVEALALCGYGQEAGAGLNGEGKTMAWLPARSSGARGTRGKLGLARVPGGDRSMGTIGLATRGDNAIITI
ncbi:hypothetical protein E2562_035837 [Oryza meyeriana var. granulata]|uniref:Uncharacterized protein n=1 Tax=Oryza meyeriana var. granulata TaxID=110450 RepID=A0A6G1BPT2_9ORYZ|nr:hypothetical protein E2562_035837 [Oryza meyeriana var. granulata]